MVSIQSLASLSDVNHNRKWDGRALEYEQRENVQKGKKYDCPYNSLTVFGFICLLRKMRNSFHNIYFGMLLFRGNKSERSLLLTLSHMSP